MELPDLTQQVVAFATALSLVVVESKLLRMQTYQ